MSGDRGVFIAFEGGDGAGKSTQVRLLADRLRGSGHDPVLTRQPGGTVLGRRLRDLVLHGDPMSPRAEALIFAADKAQHVDEVVRPALTAGRVVISDRYTDSSVAYQGAGRELGADEVHRLQMWAVDGLVPDLTVIVDITAEEGRRRRGEVHDRLESEADGFHEAVRSHFHALAATAPDRYLVVNGTGDPDGVADDVWARVRLLLDGAAS
ncbi:dTMP kinase [Nostocoides sp. F2B08]|uniref:dTMP kinase n=1 Tax=Nostocoides sp. F2B08 TaxID=2653936 RepID=UPI001262F03B|nr:dTMP kinase [Tetrasphaera sp. F2B08]KAB7746507.1 dTMP kinase [Tetrasphaera sp. F2B08]